MTKDAREGGSKAMEAEARAYDYIFAIYGDGRGVTGRVRKVMALADAEHDQLWDVIRANGETNARLMRERDEARAAIERVRALCDSYADYLDTPEVLAALRTP